MTEVPVSDWLAAQDDKAALKQAVKLKGLGKWHRRVGVVTHVFTHFPLELVVYGRNGSGPHPRAGSHALGADATLQDEALPNVMRKVIAHGLGGE